MEKRSAEKYLNILSFAVIMLFICLFCAFFMRKDYVKDDVPTLENDAEPSELPSVVVIDAGHGGEDGGAISKSGIYEKDLNLSVALMLRDYYTSVGIPTVLTREGDVLLYDKNSDYHGRKKVMDLANRLKIASSTENPLFISIHMNAFTQTQYNGLQVWYSKNNALSREVAKDIQLASRTVQPSNYRQEKAADSKLFLLDNLNCPAVLVECGFLSNESDAEKLSSEEYRRLLAFVIFTSTVKYVEKS